MKKLIYILLFFSMSIKAQMLINSYAYVSGGAFETEYQAILDEATTLVYTLPSGADQIIQNQIVADLKTNGLWSGIDAMFYFKGSGGTDFKKINWKNPTGAKAVEVGGGSLTFSSTGVLGDGVNYLDLAWNPTDDGSNYTQNNFSYWVDVVTLYSSNSALLEGLVGSSRSLALQQGSTFQYYHSTGNGARDIQDISTTGFYIGDFLTNTIYLSKNGAASSDTSTGKTTDSFPTTDMALFKVGASNRGDCGVGSLILSSSLNGNTTNYTNAYNSLN